MKERNYLLFMPSLMRNGCNYITYTSPENDKEFTGLQTNIPATEYVMDSLHQKSKKLHGILMLCSDEVLKQPILPEGFSQPITTCDYYKAIISQQAQTMGYTQDEIENLFIVYPLAEINPGDQASMQKIQNALKERIIDTNGGRLYLDYTGGLRSASMLLLFFARLLEELSNKSIKVEQVLYSSIYHGSAQGTIENCVDTYHLFDILDAINASAHEDYRGAEAQAKKMGSTALNNEISQAKEASSKKKAGNYDAAAKIAEKDEIVVKHDDLVTEALSNAVKKQRTQMSKEGALKQCIDTGKLKEAALIICEQGIDILIEKDALRCPRRMKNDKKKVSDAFSAYARYYGTYLKFVKEMLEAIKGEKGRDVFYSSYKAYIQEHTRLTPSKKGTVTVSPYLEREFSQVYPDLMQQLDEELVAQMGSADITPVKIRDALANYERKRNAYLITYTKVGFPFGNFNALCFSFSVIREMRYFRENGETKSESICKLYSEEYLRLLDKSMDQLMAVPMDELEEQIDSLLQDPMQLAEFFPPIFSKSLFTPSNRDMKMFGQMVVLIQRIRQNRNTTVHHGSQVTSVIIDELRQQVMKFYELLQRV